MRKILSIFAVALTGCLLATSCSDDNDFVQNGLEVVSAENTSLPSVGGTGTVVTAKPITQAYTLDNWLNVTTSGSTATISAAEYVELQSRSTQLVLKASAVDSVVVNVTQYGAVCQVDNSDIVLSNNDATTLKVQARHDLPLQVTTDADWLTVRVDDQQLIIDVAKNNSGNLRAGSINYVCGKVSGSIYVKQFDFEENIPGDYLFAGFDVNNRTWVYWFGKLELVDATNALFSFSSPEDISTWKLPLTYDAATASLRVKAGSFVGTHEAQTSARNPAIVERFVWTVMWDNESGASSWAEGGMIGSFDVDPEDGTIYTELADDGTAGENPFTGGQIVMTICRFAYFTSGETASGTTMVSGNWPYSSYADLAYLTFVKL